MDWTDDELRALGEAARTRSTLWADFVNRSSVTAAAEVGVFRGEFAARLLDRCPGIERFYLIDPWRHLDDWNKPANTEDDAFEGFFQEAMQRTEAHADTRVVLRGTTTEVVDRIDDGELDFAYVDGDHTLRGITIDLQRLWPKVRVGGWLAGDDFLPSIWQHASDFEPTLVFPYAVHFAEAVGARIHALPHQQFLMQRTEDDAFAFVDHTGRYTERELQQHVSPRGTRVGTATLDPSERPGVVRRVARRLRSDRSAG